MENPCLTFIIASILESSEFLLIDVVHEIAHGWFGNAVTNATWEEMWLSEGLATYAQRRITSQACGRRFRRYHNLVSLLVLDFGLQTLIWTLTRLLVVDSGLVTSLVWVLNPGQDTDLVPCFRT